MHIANSDKPIALYGLDIILAVGYRTNSRRAIEFRRWATKTFRQYIVEGMRLTNNVLPKTISSFWKQWQQ